MNSLGRCTMFIYPVGLHTLCHTTIQGDGSREGENKYAEVSKFQTLWLELKWVSSQVYLVDRKESLLVVDRCI